MPVTDIKVSESILKKLGEERLGEVCSCLWPVDCQTCGRFLGDAPPALAVDETPLMASASLHHLACRPPEWNDSGLIIDIHEEHLSWVSVMLMFPVVPPGGGQGYWPMLLVNPGLESVPIVKDDRRGYQVLRSGVLSLHELNATGLGMDVSAPLDDAVATLAADSVSVSFTSGPHRTYTAPADEQFLDAARALGGVLVGVSHALHPDHLDTTVLNQAILNGWIGVGRVQLHGASASAARPRTPDRPQALYTLEWNSKHMSVGRVLGHDTADLTIPEAMRWADGLIGADVSSIGWTPVDDDRTEEGWFTLDALSLQMYFLRRHPDGWRLVLAYARVAGKTDVETDNEAKAWAINHLKRKGQPTKLTWTPGPSTPAARTLYARA
ncbi:hypothetical protein [Actinomadura sp. NBRC 104425]|uniref:hypothetical protein n=1 Tax=Actinomadura sp. NBRC 104425 TaxID=3032204 RepID=UPI0025535E0B|nr:hypothetical protein [Actinomadura sp. NBRC 104425]